MSSDPQYDQGFSPEPPQKKGMSTGMKVLIILLCVFGGLALLCCGGVIYVFVKFKNAVSEDPATVAVVQKKIAEMDIPAAFQPKASADIDFWFFPAKVRFVVYGTADANGSLVLMDIAVPNSEEDMNEAQQRQMQQQMQQQMEQRGQGKNVKNLEVKKSEPKKFTIRGKEVVFRFAQAVDPKTKVPYHQVNGSFPGREKNSAVVLMLQVPDKDFNEAQIVKMIESIK